MVNDKRVVIIDEKQQAREGLAALIDDADGFQCIGTFDSIETALLEIVPDYTELLLIDIGVPGISGIKKNNPNLPFLVLSVYEDDERIFDALCAGASGYLLKKTSPAQLIKGLKDAINGEAVMSPEIAGRILKFFREIHAPAGSEYQLTPHEIRILKLLAEGHNYKTASAELGFNVNMISSDVKQIYEKLQVLAELVSR
ncbi:MAG TPA: response regulator transcription factor [Acidobacteriota bacterium]|jgi:DNA-binding NarL/FixJ family response regulator